MHKSVLGRCLTAVSLTLPILGLSACGNTSATSKSPSKPAATSAAAPSSSASTVSSSAKASTSTGKLPTLTLTYSSNTGNRVPLWIGVEKGFFKKSGVDVKLQLVHGSATALAALIGNHTSIYEGSTGHLLAAMTKGAPVKIIGFAEYTIPYQLYVDPSIKTPSQLSGKTLAVIAKGDSSYLFVVRMLKAMHLSGKVKLVPAGSRSAEFAAFVSHNAEGMPTTPADIIKAKPGTYRVLGDPAKYGITGDANAIAVTDSYLKGHQTELKDFLKGYSEALAYAFSHPAEVKAVYAQKLHTNTQYNDATYQEFFKTAPANGGLPPDPTPTLQLVKEQIANEKAAQPSFQASKIQPSEVLDASLMQSLVQSSSWKQIWPNGLPSFSSSGG